MRETDSPVLSRPLVCLAAAVSLLAVGISGGSVGAAAQTAVAEVPDLVGVWDGGFRVRPVNGPNMPWTPDNFPGLNERRRASQRSSTRRLHQSTTAFHRRRRRSSTTRISRKSCSGRIGSCSGTRRTTSSVPCVGRTRADPERPQHPGFLGRYEGDA